MALELSALTPAAPTPVAPLLLYSQVTPLCFLVTVEVLVSRAAAAVPHSCLTVPLVKSAWIQLLVVPVLLPGVQGSRFVALGPLLASLFPLLNIFMMLATWAQVFSLILDHWLPVLVLLLAARLYNPLNSIFFNTLLLPSGAVL